LIDSLISFTVLVTAALTLLQFI